MLIKRFCVFLLLAPAVLGGEVHADEIGLAGFVQNIAVKTVSADTYLQTHGELVILQTSNEQLTTYRWGGTACGSKVLTDAQLSYLMDFASAPYMVVEPIHKPGQGDSKCLVGFTAYNVKYE